MCRIAFLRSIEIQHTKPFLTALEARLQREDTEAKLFYTGGECGPDDFPGESEKIAGDISAEELAKKVIDWGAHGVISLSITDENAHSLHRLQRVQLPALHPGRDLAGRGGPRARPPAGVPAVPGARTLSGIRARRDPRAGRRTDAVTQYRWRRPPQCDHHLRARRPGGTSGEARIALAAPRIHRPVIPEEDRSGRTSGRRGCAGDRYGNGMTRTEVWEKEMKETAGSHAD